MNLATLKQLKDQLEGIKVYELDEDVPWRYGDVAKHSLSSLKQPYNLKRERNREVIILYKNKKVISKTFAGKHPTNTFLGRLICNDKTVTDYYLNLNNISTPQSQLFDESQFNEAYQYVVDSGIKMVIKPTNLLQSAGVFTNVDKDNFKEYWQECVKIQKRYFPKRTSRIIVQEQLEGIEIRIIVIEGIFQSALIKMPWLIEGDGKTTIEEFIHIRNREGDSNRLIRANQIKIDQKLINRLKKDGIALDTILPIGDLYQFAKFTNSLNGGRRYEVTDLINPKLKEFGVNTVKAIPGLSSGGVDIYVNDIQSPTGKVLEVNKNPSIQASNFPYKGKPHNLINVAYKNHLFDHKIIEGEVTKKDDLSDEEFNYLMKKFKYLYEKDVYNTSVIGKYHHTKFK